MHNNVNVAERLSFLLNNRKIKKINPNQRMLRNFRSASVLVLIVAGEGKKNEKLVFTKRTTNLTHHKGQISFPGGKHDSNIDNSLLDTALRETEEEIGILPDNYEVLGRLDDSLTVSRFIVTPYVAYSTKKELEYSIRETEVENLIEVPISHLLARKKGYYWTKWHFYKIRLFKIHYYRYDEFDVNNHSNHSEMESHIIWGATGRILEPFLRIIERDDILRNYWIKEN
ncbi:MAG: NUDIX hydrolase [Candidatus Odinarchaeota archaeon]